MAAKIVAKIVSLPSEVTSSELEVVSLIRADDATTSVTAGLQQPRDITQEDLTFVSGLDVAKDMEIGLEDQPVVAVLGCGYVGTNLIGEFSQHYDVLGFDVSAQQIKAAAEKHGGEASRVQFTIQPERLAKATHFLVAVPTLLMPDKTIDTSYVRSALSTVEKHARRGATIVIESSVAVGMTRALLGPLAKTKGFFAGMSPERVDPGRTEPPMHTIPKVLSGLDDVVPGSLAAITRLYSRAFETIVPVSKPEVAEMMKLYENCQRMMCIAYANEMADACVGHGIDPFEVCKAAASKPFGYMPFTPSLGVGGHCIPVNPYYLLSNSDFPLLRSATEKMWRRPEQIGERALQSLFKTGKPWANQHGASRPDLPHNDSSLDVSFDHVEPVALASKLNKLRTSNPPRRMSQFTSPATGTGTPAELDSPGSSVSSLEPSSPPETTETSVSSSSAESPVQQPRVLVVGVGFKPGQSVLSNSPGQKLVHYLANSKLVKVMFADPLVPQSAIPTVERLDEKHWNKEKLQTFNMIIVAIKQIGFDFGLLNDLEGVKVQTWFP